MSLQVPNIVDNSDSAGQESRPSSRARVRIGLGTTSISPSKSPRKRITDELDLGPRADNQRVKVITHLMRLVEKFPQYVRDISDFQYDHRIGTGGFGEVWMGNDLRTGKVVAIKELFADKLAGRALSNYCREINTMCRVRSRFVVPFVGFTVEPPYSIITEYMPNGSLFYYTNKTQRSFEMSGTHLSIIAMCLAHGMSSIRAARIVHRDLKGANVLLDDNRLPMICDFGVARFETKEGRKTQKVGTYSHMAPEVMTSRDYSYDSDKYSYGMLLYEMAESRNPFGNVKKPKELLEMVPAGASPPLMETDTPEPLVRLMKALWDREPSHRPTWKQIFYMWAKGQVYFKGTDVEAVAEFAKPLEKTLGENGKRGEEQEPVVDIDAAMEKLKARLDRVLKTVDAFGNDLTSDSDDNTTDPFALPRSGSPGASPRRREASLRDPDSPDFDRALDYFAGVIVPKQFQALYLEVRGYLTDPPANETVARRCIATFSKLVERDREFLKPMARMHVFVSLPVSTPRLIDASFDLVALLFLKDPELVDQSLKRTLGVFIKDRPEDSAQLLAMYVSQCEKVSSPNPIVDLYLAYARAFFDNPGGAVLVQSICFMIDKDPKCKESMISVIGPIFTAFCTSKCAATAKAAVRGMVLIIDMNVTVPFDALCRNMTQRDLYRCTLSLFLRVKEFPVSRTICNVLTDKALTYPRTFEALWRFADQQLETAQIVANNTKWMNSGSPDAFVLFLILFKHASLRNILTHSPLFGTFMTRMAATENKDILIAIPSIFRRANLNQDIIDNLTECTFFKRFLCSVKKFDDLSVLSACNTLLDHISRIGTTSDLALFLPLLGKMLSFRNELATGAIYVITSFSYHRFLAEKLRNPELMNYFEAILKIPSLEKIAQVFLRNIEVVQ